MSNPFLSPEILQSSCQKDVLILLNNFCFLKEKGVGFPTPPLTKNNKNWLLEVPQEDAHYNVVKFELSSIQMLEDLKKYLEEKDSSKVWQPSEHKGAKGFRGVSKEVQNLEYVMMSEFYLTAPGTVTQISYQLTASRVAEVLAIHQSLSWLP